jgi:drug/metabolite transporter superfamily protein YnfA
MIRAKLLKAVLVVVGLLFVALVYPMVLFVRQEAALAMMLSVYVTLGVFLLLASRHPSAHRSLIAFTAWSSLVHASLMVFQVSRRMIDRGELIGTGVLFLIGIVLLLLSPPKLDLPTPS